MNGLLPANLLGYPMIEQNGWVFQTRFRPLIDIIGCSPDAIVRDFVDGVIECVRLIIRRGAMSPFFALPYDYAIDSRSSIVMTGFGSLLFHRDHAFRELNRKPWLSQASGVQAIPNSVREYYASQMELAFSTASLSREWASDVRSLDC